MSYHVSDEMPQEWIAPALDSIGMKVSDDRAAAVEARMREAYRAMLVKIRIQSLHASLRVACFAAAQMHKDG